MAIDDYKVRHLVAWQGPRTGCERGIKLMVTGLEAYAMGYSEELGAPIGDDGVIGEEWKDIAKAVIGLLNGPTGRFDCGSVESLIRDLAAAHGFDPDLEP